MKKQFGQMEAPPAINAANLNKIEQGIYEAHNNAETNAEFANGTNQLPDLQLHTVG